MPGRKPKPPRLWLREDVTPAVWVILDRGRQIRTGFSKEETEGAARALGEYLASRHESTVGARNPVELALADVLTAYAEAMQPKGINPDRLRRHSDLLDRIGKLVDFWGDKTLAAVKGQSCRDYVAWRTAQPLRHAKTEEALKKRISASTARRELEDLRSAIRHYHAEHTLVAVPQVVLPEKAERRDRWLSRHEAARLLGATLGFVWDTDENDWKREQNGKLFRRDRVTRTRRRHITRFVLIGLYSGRREQAIRRTQWGPNTVGGWIDFERWIYHGRGQGEKETKKRRPPAKVAYRLRPHLLRWKRLDDKLAATLPPGMTVQHIVHKTDGQPLADKIKTGWTGVLADAGLGDDVVRHCLRHTSATWLMQSGTDLWMAAGFLGMTVEMLQENYGHHHPDFQEEAAGAFGGRTATGGD